MNTKSASAASVPTRERRFSSNFLSCFVERLSMFRFQVWLAVFSVVLSGTSFVRAETVIVDFEGTVGILTDSNGFLAGAGVVPGDSFTGHFVYDTATSPWASYLDIRAQYWPMSFEFVIGEDKVSFTWQNGGGGLGVDDGFNGWDMFAVNLSGKLVNVATGEELYINTSGWIADRTAALMSDTSLPTLDLLNLLVTPATNPGYQSFSRTQGTGVDFVASNYKWTAGLANNTQTGTDVIVTPSVVDENGDPIPDAPGVSLNFASVTGAGDTTVTVTEQGPPPPAGFRLGTPPIYLNIETEATFSGPVQICIDYSIFAFGGNLSKLKLAHYEDGAWVNITTSNDTDSKMICGTVTSLSPFAIFEEGNPVVMLDDLVAAVSALNVKKGIINSLDAKLDAAKKALTDAKASNDLSAMNILISAFINAVEAQRGKELLDSEAENLVARANEISLVLAGASF